MPGLTIRARLILLASVGLLVLVATNAYLTRALSENSAGMVKAAGLLAGIEQADSARIAFGEVRYWMTDLAVSQLTLSERNAATARARSGGASWQTSAGGTPPNALLRCGSELRPLRRGLCGKGG